VSSLCSSGCTPGQGGAASSGGAGGNGNSVGSGAGGGGAGFFGGGGGGGSNGAAEGGGGGSGHLDTGTGSVSNGTLTTGGNTSTNGTVVITYRQTTTLTVSKTGPSTATPGSTITYSVTVANETPGNVVALNAQMTDALPAGTTFVSVGQTFGPPGWTCGDVSNTVTCSASHFAAGAGAVTFAITAQVAPSFTGVLSNVASALADNAAPVTSSPPVLTSVACTQNLSSTTGNVTVPAGGTTCGSGVTIDGNVTVAKGGSLVLTNSTVGRNLTANGANLVVVCGTHVGRTLSVVKATGPVVIGDAGDDGSPACAPDSMGRAVLRSNTGGVELGGATVTAAVVFNKNVAPTSPVESENEIEANNIGGRLSCNSNSSVSNGGLPNTAGSKSGQCGAPGF